jgi:hypothetical protein
MCGNSSDLWFEDGKKTRELHEIQAKVDWMKFFVSCCNAESKYHSDPLDICILSLLYQLPNCNLFTHHVIIYLMERHH